MSALSLIAGIIGALMYVPLCIQVLLGKVKQNFATWALWMILDGISAATIISQKGNFLLPVAYSLGSGAVALSILKSKNFKWTWIETMDVCLVVVSVIVWMHSGTKMATIVSSIAVVIAGVPQTIETYEKPHKQPFLVYTGFLIANILTVAGAKEWSVKERFFPVAMTVMSLVIFFFSARKFWLKIQPESRPA